MNGENHISGQITTDSGPFRSSGTAAELATRVQFEKNNVFESEKTAQK